MAYPSVYTYNFCPNPSFEFDLTGVTAVNGAAFVTDSGTGLYGPQSLKVTTPGVVTNEGVILPPGTTLDATAGAVSFYLTPSDVTSTGTLNVYAIDTTSSTTLGSTTVTFDSTTSWVRVQITGLTFANAHTIAVYVETNSIQATSFNIDGVQYEPQTALNGGVLPTPYIDGDEPFGHWVGTTNESASYKLYQYQLSGSGNIQLTGYGSLLQQGQVFYLVNTDPANGPTQVTGNIDLSGQSFQGLTGVLSGGGVVTVSGITTLLMYAGLDDFAIFTSADIDPAISLVGYNNSGIAVGTNTSGSAGYTRPYATFSAPIAFQGSTGKNVWNTAAYFAVGYQLTSLGTNAAQNVTHVQAELVGGKGVAVTPTAYVRPRALTATLAPTRLNYVTNPSFETSTTGWGADAGSGVTISQVASGAVTGSTHSAQVVTTGTNLGMYITVTNLIVGEVYTASAYVQNTTNATANTGKITAGATSATVSMPQNSWVRVSVTFTATTSNVALDIQTATAGTFLVDAVLLEVGNTLNAYADGSFSGWNWEDPTQPNVTRSYFYERAGISYAAVQSILNAHLPLGIHAYAPVYNSPPTQYS